ncbi:DUF4293 family protein [Blattabacterium cuenoti]|uniref:DUF4293 family protein n=1 Tax=Blattabacterium cuenoti TaxID=1653831 RepID=UPI00163C4F17|nr:DUF4293 family protein [Blattabacterium cuenoti]
MLYRKQTLYSLISIFIYSFSLYFYPHIFIHSKKIVFIILCLILSFLSFFSFKNRKYQILMNKINIFLNSTHFILIIFFSYKQFIKEFLFLFIVLSCFCNTWILFLANKAIKKDLEFIQSINRIR